MRIRVKVTDKVSGLGRVRFFVLYIGSTEAQVSNMVNFHTFALVTVKTVVDRRRC